jgi:hypothetical protein
MTEPIYKFVKGQGWVVACTQRGTARRHSEGKDYLVTVEHRKPERGEYGYWVGGTYRDDLNTAATIVHFYYGTGKFGWLSDGTYEERHRDMLLTVFTEEL